MKLYTEQKLDDNGTILSLRHNKQKPGNIVIIKEPVDTTNVIKNPNDVIIDKILKEKDVGEPLSATSFAVSLISSINRVASTNRRGPANIVIHNNTEIINNHKNDFENFSIEFIQSDKLKDNQFILIYIGSFATDSSFIYCNNKYLFVLPNWKDYVHILEFKE